MRFSEASEEGVEGEEEEADDEKGEGEAVWLKMFKIVEGRRFLGAEGAGVEEPDEEGELEWETEEEAEKDTEEAEVKE